MGLRHITGDLAERHLSLRQRVVAREEVGRAVVGDAKLCYPPRDRGLDVVAHLPCRVSAAAVMAMVVEGKARRFCHRFSVYPKHEGSAPSGGELAGEGENDARTLYRRDGPDLDSDRTAAHRGGA